MTQPDKRPAADVPQDALQMPPELAMLECRLQRQPAPAGSPLLRHRVLMAVDDVLSARPSAAVVDRSARIPGWAWAVAAAVAVAVTLPMATVQRTILGRDNASLLLTKRLQAAGFPADDFVAAVSTPAMAVQLGHDRAAPATRSIPTAPSAPRGFDTRRLLQELL